VQQAREESEVVRRHTHTARQHDAHKEQKESDRMQVWSPSFLDEAADFFESQKDHNHRWRF
jgi:hypothetical protein